MEGDQEAPNTYISMRNVLNAYLGTTIVPCEFWHVRCYYLVDVAAHCPDHDWSSTQLLLWSGVSARFRA